MSFLSIDPVRLASLVRQPTGSLFATLTDRSATGEDVVDFNWALRGARVPRVRRAVLPADPTRGVYYRLATHSDGLAWSETSISP